MNVKQFHLWRHHERWALTFSAYDYTMTFREGKANANADALSCLPLPNHITVTPAPADVVHLLDLLSKTPVNAENIRNWTRVDPRLSKVYHYVRTEWPRSITENDLELKPYFDRRTELSVHNGVLLWGSRVVVPPQGRISILHELHSAHPGIVRMKTLARSYVWWPKLDVDIDNKIRACRDSQIQRDLPAKAPLHPWNWPDKPWTRLHLDYAGPFLGQMYLIIIDAYSKWLEVIPTSTSTAQVTAKLCRRVFTTHGLPCSIVTDNGTSFTGREFQEFTKRNGIKLSHTSSLHPAPNGLAENAVKTFKRCLRKGNGDFDLRLQRFLFQYRNTPHSTTGLPPSAILLRRHVKSPLSCTSPFAEQRVHERQSQQKSYADMHRHVISFSVGDHVVVCDLKRGQVTGKSGPYSYEVCLQDGRVFR